MSDAASSPEIVEDPHDEGNQGRNEGQPGAVQGREDVRVEDGSNTDDSRNDPPQGTLDEVLAATLSDPAPTTEHQPSGFGAGVGFNLPSLSALRFNEDEDEHSPIIPRPVRRLSQQLDIHGLIRETPHKRSAEALVKEGRRQSLGLYRAGSDDDSEHYQASEASVDNRNKFKMVNP